MEYTAIISGHYKFLNIRVKCTVLECNTIQRQIFYLQIATSNICKREYGLVY